MRKQRAFTLIELLIVVTVVGILTAIALPAYQEQVRKTHRADARIALLNAAQHLERCYTEFHRYDADACPALPAASPQGHYALAVVRGADTFLLTATPRADGPQARDAYCTALTFDHLQTTAATGTDTGRCW
ncbi:prepilin-type N-terminal cleavage/methylation domain-containing protein [Ectothiorhodospiraceae bacterium 2226]|nr:prepilin-type N-terminal cleavage/methylation domain-containing protein [Ectothiorhodospiraceae bacterium 2226]